MNTSPYPRIADSLASELHDHGARHAFGVAGGETLTLIDALNRAGIAYHTTRHENAAGFIAEGVWRRGGGLPLLLATIGPGVANATNVTANALQDQVPLIVLGGRTGLDSPPVYTHQVIDQTALFRPITKLSVGLETGRARSTLRSAVRCALTPPRGPVYLDCPADRMDRAVESLEEETPSRAESPPRPDPEASPRSLADALEASERPLVLVGLQALDAPELVRAFLERWRPPVIQSYKAKGVVPESAEHCVGAAGLSPLADELLLPLCARADLVVLLGADPVEMRSNWNAPFRPEAPVIALTPGAPRGLSELASEIHEGPWERLEGLAPSRHGTWPDEEPQRVRDQLKARFEPKPRSPRPLTLMAELAAWLAGNPNAILTVDTGAHRILLAQALRCEQPGALLHSTGFCTMACALPLAIGAKVAEPHRDIVAIVGDGGLEMGLGELATARDLGTPITVVVVDDAAFALIEMKQRARGFGESGVLLGRSDFRALADAMGGHGVQLQPDQSLADELERARRRREFTLIHIRLERGAYDGLF